MLKIKALNTVYRCFKPSKKIYMSKSTAALLIAILFHLLLYAIYYILMHSTPKTTKKPSEHRIKVALKEQPKTSKKPAAVVKKVQPVSKAPSLPRGKQLKKITPKKKSATPPPPKKVQKQVLQKRKPIEKQIPQRKQVIVKKSTKQKNVSKEPEKKSNLYSMLSKKQKNTKQVKKKAQSGSQIAQDFKEAYGEKFGSLSAGEQKYIIDNQEIMRRITQEQLNRLAPVNIPRSLNVNTMNIIEFYLHPNGDITDLKIISPSGKQILDDTSLQTIEYSYHRYPLPKQKTLVRYKVGYHLGHSRY